MTATLRGARPAVPSALDEIDRPIGFPAGRSLSIAAAVIAALTSSRVDAATVNYVGPVGGFWDIAGNWNPRLPTTTDDVNLGVFNTEIRQDNFYIRSFNGSGTLKLSGGFVSVAQASTIGALNLAGGAVGGDGPITAGTLTFTTGTLLGNATTTVTGPATFDGSHSQAIGGKLTLNGASTWTAADAGHLDFAFAAPTIRPVLTIGSGGTFADQGNLAGGQTRSLGFNAGTVNNAGTYTRTGLGTTQFNSTFNNSGTVNLDGGAITTYGGTSSGTWNIAAGTQLQVIGQLDVTGGSIINAGTLALSGNAYLNMTGGSITNTGTLSVSGGTNTIATGSTYSGNGAINISGGQLFISNYLSPTQQVAVTPKSLTATGGTASFVAPVTTGVLTIAGGEVDFYRGVTAGSLTFTSGTIGGFSGSGNGVAPIATVTGLATFDGNNNQRVDSGLTLNLNGRTTWSASNGGSIDLNINSASIISTLGIGSGATFTDEGNLAGSQVRLLGSSVFDSVVSNAGTYSHVGIGTTQFNASLNNTGMLNVVQGAIDLHHGGTSSGTVTIASGSTLQVSAKTYSLTGGSISGAGTLQTSGTGILDIRGASSVSTGFLDLQGTATGNLVVGTKTVLVASDYTNASFGSGNAFNKRANITGTGAINGANAAQAITGNNVTNGATSNATLTIGNMHVGSATYDYRVANTGSGAALRGALQTTGNGAAISDSRLSGTGITAQNFGPLYAGSDSGSLAVTFTAASAGLLSPLAGTNTVHVANNFSNVAEQNLGIVLAGGAAAYNYAAGSTTPGVITVAARVGGPATQALTVNNTATAGAFSEDLRATFGGRTGAATTNGGLATNVVAGTSNNTALAVGVATSTAGINFGSVTINYASTGTVNGVSNGLGSTELNSQTLQVNGKVYAAAAAAASTRSIDFGIVHVNDAVAAQGITVTNSAAVTALNDTLLVAAIGASGPFTASGNASLNAQETNTTALKVGLNTNVAGIRTGTALFSVASHDSDQSDLALASLVISLTGTVNNFASDAFAFGSGAGSLSRSGSTYTLDYGTVTQGSGNRSTTLVAANTATGPADLLDGAFQFIDPLDFSESGFADFIGLAAGSTTGPLTFSFDTGSVGAFLDTIVLHGVGTNASGYSGAIGDIQLVIRGNVNAAVSPVSEPDPFVLLAVGVPAIVIRRSRRKTASSAH